MASRKLAQEVDKCFKKVAEGVIEFQSIYEKIEQSSNPAQKEKLEDNLKREIKKLQRLRDQIKTWAASNDVKDKAPLLEHRRLIETQMEKFKAVEKAMKTKAYSKEGLSAAAKLDPKEQAKVEAADFLSSMVDALEQQVEALEAESESLQATMKKGKGQNAKAERVAEIETVIERHKWHQGKLELIRRSLENGGVETEQVRDLEESIRYYVSDGMNDDFMNDDELYDELNLEIEEDAYGMNQENEKGSSEDTHSVQEDATPEPESKPAPSGKARAAAEPSQGRRPSTQLKSPLPALATLHTTGPSGASSSMKPAALPARPPGEGLKYASAAAAAAASDKNNVGIAPLPPPPGASSSAVGINPLPPVQSKHSATSSPAAMPAQPAVSQQPVMVESPPQYTIKTAPLKGDSSKGGASLRSATSKAAAAAAAAAAATATASSSSPATTEASRTGQAKANGLSNGIKPAAAEGKKEKEEEEESIYHLPESLRDLVDAFEVTRRNPPAPTQPATIRRLEQSQQACPDVLDAEPPKSYRPDMPVPPSSANYPDTPLSLLDDARLYSRIEPDTLFYIFYYKQGTPQQYLAAKALKDQSWRFHKQYQTWFQRHEEPKSITEEYEQGTYRFFDYESTWMNRRKADFKFVYKYLEDEI